MDITTEWEWAAVRVECSLSYALEAEARSNAFQRQLVRQPGHVELQRQVRVWQAHRDEWLESACNWEAIAHGGPRPFV